MRMLPANLVKTVESPLADTADESRRTGDTADESSATLSLDRSHFFAIAATVMRQILIDRARAAHALKRGGGIPAITLTAANGELAADDPAALLQVDAALGRVRSIDARLATLVELKVFGGMNVAELADALAISERLVKRHWRQAIDPAKVCLN